MGAAAVAGSGDEFTLALSAFDAAKVNALWAGALGVVVGTSTAPDAGVGTATSGNKTEGASAAEAESPI